MFLLDRLASASSTSTTFSKQSQDDFDNGDIEEAQEIVEIAHLNPPKRKKNAHSVLYVSDFDTLSFCELKESLFPSCPRIC